VAVSPGLGDGSFGNTSSYRAVAGGEGDVVTSFATGDFNRDGRADVVVGPDGEGVLDIMLAAPFKRGACANPKLTPPAIGGFSVTEGTRYGDSIHGGRGKDTIDGLGGGDCLYGGGVHWKLRGVRRAGASNLTPDNKDTLRGGAGDDRLYGMTGNDRLYGGPGNDLLVGGSGRNGYYGGPGNDRIRARNGIAETVQCGPGRDTVIADRSDRLIGCEVAPRPR
jgi:Ca2+-binding RTX toxin-like protein